MSLRSDIRYALRLALRRKGLTAATLLMLSVGIAANAAIFALVHGILLDPLPFRDPSRVVIVWETDLHNGEERGGASKPDFDDWVRESHSFSSLTAFTTQSANLTGGEARPERVIGAEVTARFLSTLGIAPALGRDFSAAEMAQNGPSVVMISHALWQRRFGGARDVVGSTLVVDGTSRTIIGVLGRQRSYPLEAEIFYPMIVNARIASRGMHGLVAIGRLRDGVTVRQSGDEMAAIMRLLDKQYPDDVGGRGAFVEPIHEAEVGSSKSVIILLFGASLVLLLLVCGNVAGLMLARASERSGEVAIRQSLGASRGRIVRQLLVESTLLGLMGGAGAIALSPLMLRGLKSLAPANLPRMDNVAIDPLVFAFLALVAIVTGVVAGLIPALQATGTSRTSLLLAGWRGSIGDGRKTARQGLVVLQVALAVVLVVGAGLVSRTLANLSSVDPGFRTAGTLALDVALPDSRYHPPDFGKGYPNWPEAFHFYDTSVETIRVIPGVKSVALALNHPLRAGWTSSTTIEGRVDSGGPKDESRIRPVSAGYFDTTGMRLLSGRGISESDTADSAAVVVVNHVFARKYFGKADPIGKRVVFWSTPRTIIGVVHDTRFLGLDQEPEPALYPSLYQTPMSNVTFVVRGEGDPKLLIRPVQEAIWSVDPELALYHVETVSDTLARSLAPQRFRAALMSFFGAIALLLAAVGIYGLIAYQVTRRTREIGVRMALGAEADGVLFMVLREGATLAILGVVLGLATAIPASKLVASLLFGVERFDASTFVGAGVALVASALAASLIPARRASKLDPVVALREE